MQIDKDELLEQAKELLKKSGFYLKDNKLYDKSGNRVEFELLTNAGNTQREATGVSIKEDLQKLGMKVNFKPVEFNSLVAKLSNTYDWDAILIALTGNPLEGTWVSEGSGDKIEITDDDQMIIRPEEGDRFTEIRCNVDTKTKILTVAEGPLDSDIIQPGTYNYNIEQDTLTLTEREYGEQLVFVREQE